jgi:hypothetical protein
MGFALELFPACIDHGTRLRKLHRQLEQFKVGGLQVHNKKKQEKAASTGGGGGSRLRAGK